jgi:hypothetical protein
MRRYQADPLPPIAAVYAAVTGRSIAGVSPRIDGSVVVSCPSERHNDRHPSCAVNVKKNVFYCRSCGVGGGVLDLPIVAGLSRNRRESAQLLRERGLL